MKPFINRAYNRLEVLKESPGVIIKKSFEPRLWDEICYYNSLPEQQALYFPRMIRAKTRGSVEDGHELAMEYYGYDNLGDLMINQYPLIHTWRSVFDFIDTFANENPTRGLDKESCRSMFVDKTETEYHKLIESSEFFKSFDHQDKTVILNGTTLASFPAIWPTIKWFLEESCLDQPLRIIHGDMCFSNILYGQNPISGDVVLKFIDPRGSFGTHTIFGDPYYDMAKLMHSCDGGYEYFITDKFSLTERDNYFWLSYENRHGKILSELLFKRFKERGYNMRKIIAIQGAIFIGMCARHYDSFQRQKAMFLTGLRLLNKAAEMVP